MKHTLLLLFIFLSFISNAQETNPFSILYNDMYFKAYTHLTENEDKYLGDKYEDSYLETLGTIHSFIGKYDKAIEYYIIRNKKKGYIPDSLKQIDLSGSGIVQDDLNNLYTKYNVAMFNESHHISQHRAFIYSQLEILKSLGYNQLALETLNDKDSTLYERNYPVKKTGFYTNDPVYGNLIRKALELGFKLIPYDTKNMRREKVQADNIFKQYNPAKGKLIVYGGYGHIAETGEYKMMGQHLKNMLEEDVLSISQFTHYHIKPVFPASNDYEFFLQKDSTNYFDYFFYTKPKSLVSNIPYWYKWMNFKTKPLNEIYNKPINYPTLIQIHNINEKDAVPVYQYLIEKEEDVLIAYPKSGEYKLKVIDKNGESEFKVVL
ncbi:MAG: hypothetical protein K8R54_18790 [Bacteroidales bacterium]|nr:hypothetical protein [Bacteroidales bacterium]